MISVDTSLFIQIANFLVLVWAMNLFVYRPIRGILAERRSTVEGLADGIETFSKQADEKSKAFQSGLRETRQAAMKNKEAIIQSAGEKEKEIISQLHEASQAELDRVRSQIGSSVEEARASLLQDVDRFANEIGEKILGRTIA